MLENLKSRNGWSIKGLGATDPDPDLKDKLMLFGQFVDDTDQDTLPIHFSMFTFC